MKFVFVSLLIIFDKSILGANINLSMLDPIIQDLSATRVTYLCKPKSLFHQHLSTTKRMSLVTTNVKHLDNQPGIVIVCGNDFESDALEELLVENIGLEIPWLVVSSNLKLDIYSEIQQNIIFLDLDTNEVYESYQVNGVNVSRSLGNVIWDQKWVFRKTVELGITDRRSSNLHGLELTILTERQYPHVMFSGALKVGQNWTTLGPSGDLARKLERDAVSGFFVDILDELARQMNFTYELFNRQDHNWGDHVNGEWSGMIKSLEKKEADMVMTSLTVTLERAQVADYLPTMAEETWAFFVSRAVSQSSVPDWSILVDPFQIELWTLLAGHALLVSIVIVVLTRLFEGSKKQDNIFYTLASGCWGVFCSYLGTFKLKTCNRLRGFILMISFVGTLVFMSYRASLTSFLSVRQWTLPFDDLDSLLQSDYKIVTLGMGYPRTLFASAKEGTIFKLLAEKHFPDNNFGPAGVPSTDRIGQLLASDEQLTALDTLESILTLPHYDKFLSCALSVAWESEPPKQISSAFPKNSTLYQFFKYRLLSVLSKGTGGQLRQKWMTVRSGCDVEQDLGLDLAKLVSVFTMLFVAGLVACLIFLSEHCSRLCGLGSRSELVVEDENNLKLLQFLHSNNIPVSLSGLEKMENITESLKQTLRAIPGAESDLTHLHFLNYL